MPVTAAPFPDNLILAFVALNPTWFILAFAGILFDLITGFIIKGVIPHNVQSAIMREGLVHKSWEVAIILSAALVDISINAGLDLGLQLVSTATCAFILLMEIASVCENALEGNPELASAPIIRYVAASKVNSTDPDATNSLWGDGR